MPCKQALGHIGKEALCKYDGGYKDTLVEERDIKNQKQQRQLEQRQRSSSSNGTKHGAIKNKPVVKFAALH